MKQKRKRNCCLLMITAMIWGAAFVAQSIGMDYIGPYTFNAIRFLIGGIVLLPMVKKQTQEKSHGSKMPLLIGGLCCGMALCMASCLQQMGIVYTTVGKAGFITAMYIVIVPLLRMMMGKKSGWSVWISVFLAVVGLYYLCMTESFTIGRGDVYVLLCAGIFSVHILLVDHFSPLVNGVTLSCIQFFVSGGVAAVAAFLWETPDLTSILSAWAPLLYAGVLSSGVGYTLQVIGQKGVDPVIASLILSLESVFSVLAGWIILGQKLSMREWAGCVLMAVAIVLAQCPSPDPKSD